MSLLEFDKRPINSFPMCPGKRYVQTLSLLPSADIFYICGKADSWDQAEQMRSVSCPELFAGKAFARLLANVLFFLYQAQQQTNVTL